PTFVERPSQRPCSHDLGLDSGKIGRLCESSRRLRKAFGHKTESSFGAKQSRVPLFRSAERTGEGLRHRSQSPNGGAGESLHRGHSGLDSLSTGGVSAGPRFASGKRYQARGKPGGSVPPWDGQLHDGRRAEFSKCTGEGS